MSTRMGISKDIPDFNKYLECNFSYDINFLKELEFVQTSCTECKHKGDCYGRYGFDDGYFILKKETLLKNPDVINYEAMMNEFKKGDYYKIYLFLS